MNWISFAAGCVTMLMAYAFFGQHQTEDEEEPEEHEPELVVNGEKTRLVTLSCQTCRKLKRHKELQPGLFECTKCKRHVDLRKIS